MRVPFRAEWCGLVDMKVYTVDQEVADCITTTPKLILPDYVPNHEMKSNNVYIFQFERGLNIESTETSGVTDRKELLRTI